MINPGIIGAASLGSINTTLALDSPITTSLSSATYYAFGFDRLVDGFSGSTVRLKRLSDNAESDFGVDSAGVFNLAAVEAWRGGADVNMVYVYDQMGSADKLITLGTVAFIRSNVAKRFGCS